jgi:outer membrane murein-binding lipoprotein Lpp
MAIDPRDPDASLVVLFRHHAIQNHARSVAEGRPIFDDIEVCDIRAPGSRNYGTFPAHSRSHWAFDPYSGGQTEVTYVQRFPRQYEQFRAHAAQTKSGTPLDYAPFLTTGRRAELRAQNIYTVEQLATIDGQELKNLGVGGREQKNLAMEYLAGAKDNAKNTTLEAELDAMRAKNMALEQDLEAARKAAEAAGEQFDEMTTDQLREYIRANTGHELQGNPNRKTLTRMAIEARPSKAA